MSEPIALPTNRIIYYSITEGTTLHGEETLEAIIPDRLPDAATVLFADGQAWKKNREDTLQITSEVTALIKAESGELYTLSCEIPVTIRGNGSGNSENTAFYQITAGHYHAHIVNSRKLSFSVEVEVQKLVCRENDFAYVTALGENTVEKQQTHECMLWRFTGSESFTVQDTLPYPDGKKAAVSIYQKKAELLIHEKKVLQDKVLLRAMANITVHYLDEDGTPGEVELTIPFTRAIELKGIDEQDRVKIALLPGILTVIPEKENAQERLSISLAVMAISKGYRPETVIGPEDGFSLKKKLIFTRSTIGIIQNVYERQEQMSRAVTMEFPENPEGILDFWVSVSPVRFGKRESAQEKAFFEMTAIFLYRVGENINLLEKKETIAWNGELGTGAKTAWIDVVRQHYTAPMSQKSEIEVEMILNISGETEKGISFITSAESEAKNTGKFSSLLITKTTHDLSLFELGKQYNAIPEEIAEVNCIDGDCVASGSRLVIPITK